MIFNNVTVHVAAPCKLFATTTGFDIPETSLKASRFARRTPDQIQLDLRLREGGLVPVLCLANEKCVYPVLSLLKTIMQKGQRQPACLSTSYFGDFLRQTASLRIVQ